MSIILAGIRELARTLGCAAHQAATVVREERSARAALSRRGFFRAAGAVAGGVCMPLPCTQTEFPVEWVTLDWSAGDDWSAFAMILGEQERFIFRALIDSGACL